MKSDVLGKKVIIEQGICEKLPFESESFDLVNAQGDVFSYSLDTDESLKEALRVLKPGGILIGSVDNLYAFLNDAISVGDIETFKKTKKDAISEIGNSEYSTKKFVTKLFTPESLEKILKENKFENIEIAGKVVFGLYDEEELVNEMAAISVLELEYCFCKELFGKAEHLHFSATKWINK
jgi:SAM-dependent methyltransferase